MIPGIPLYIHSIIIVNLRFCEIRDGFFPLFVNAMAACAVNFIERLPLFEPVDGIRPGLLCVVRRNIIFNFFLRRATEEK